jgi:hypothetical protein
MSLPSRLLGANPSIQVSSLLSGSLSTPSAKRAFIGSDFESISTVTVSSGTSASVTLSSIPQTYTHLQIRSMNVCSSASTGQSGVWMRFNSDTTSGSTNYPNHLIQGNGTSPSAGFQTSAGNVGFVTTNSTIGSNIFAVGICDILDYTDTTKYKTHRTLNGFDGNQASTSKGQVHFTSGVWLNTAAITSITLTPQDGPWGTYTTFALYGIK